jgi:hypothetical protein
MVSEVLFCLFLGCSCLGGRRDVTVQVGRLIMTEHTDGGGQQLPRALFMRHINPPNPGRATGVVEGQY